MQPTHETSDRLMAEKRLGPNPPRGAYVWQSVLKSGAKLAFGSGLSGRIAPIPSRGTCRRDQQAGHERPAAGRMDPGANG